MAPGWSVRSIFKVYYCTYSTVHSVHSRSEEFFIVGYPFSYTLSPFNSRDSLRLWWSLVTDASCSLPRRRYLRVFPLKKKNGFSVPTDRWNTTLVVSCLSCVFFRPGQRVRNRATAVHAYRYYYCLLYIYMNIIG